MADNSSSSNLGEGIAIGLIAIAVAIIIAVGIWQFSLNYRTRQELRAEAYQTCIEFDRDECVPVFTRD